MKKHKQEIGQEIHALAAKLFPICRSLTGDGVRKTLKIIQELLPQLSIYEVPSGTQCFDWTVPKEWNIRDAYIKDPDGKRIVDFKNSNLHVVGYSTPVDGEFSLGELQAHLYSLPDQPNAIPYITSYYKEHWGFCLTHEQRSRLKEGKYHVKIDSELKEGHLTYGELLIPGEVEEEVFLSTDVCHPSMANNELSGPCVTAFIARWLSQERRYYSYRIVFIPETIGSILYISKHLQELKKRVIAGFVVACIGDERTYSYLSSRAGNTLADQAALHALKHIDPNFVRYSYLERGSDERQYCSPGVDLPMASIMRSKYGTYPEYHTSLDDLQFVTPEGLTGGYTALRLAIEAIDKNCYPMATVLCEPQLGKRGLYPTLSTKTSGGSVRKMMNLLAYSDGTRSLLDIADVSQIPIWELYPLCEQLSASHLLNCKK
jgi:aminopeptidase-like protein